MFFCTLSVFISHLYLDTIVSAWQIEALTMILGTCIYGFISMWNDEYLKSPQNTTLYNKYISSWYLLFTPNSYSLSNEIIPSPHVKGEMLQSAEIHSDIRTDLHQDSVYLRH